MSSWIARRDTLIGRPEGGIRRVGPPLATLAWSFNAADYDGGTGTWTDGSGNSRNATQSNSVLRPDANPSGINGLPTVDFVAANLDNLTIENATFVNAGIFEFLTEWVIQKTLGTNNIVLRTSTDTVNQSMFNFQIDEEGFLTLITRRRGGDSANTVVSSFRLLDSVPHYLMVGCNWVNGQVYFRLDGNEETKQVRTAGVPGWASGLGPTGTGEANIAPVIGRFSGTALDAMIAEHIAWVGFMTPPLRVARYETQQATYDTVLPKVAWNAPDKFFAYRSYQMDATGKADGIYLSGRVTEGDPNATIAISLVDALTDDPAPAPYDAFQDLATAVDGNFDVTLDDVPTGHWKPQAKISGDDDFNSAIRDEWFSVTNLYLWKGQSNLRKAAGNESNVVPYPVTKPGSGSILLGRRYSLDRWADITATLTATSNSAGTGESQEPPNGPTSQNVGGGGLVEFNRLYYEEAGFAPSHLFVTIGGSPARNYEDGEANDDFVVSSLEPTVGEPDRPGQNCAGFIQGSGEDEVSEAGYTGAEYEADILSVAALTRTRAGKTAEELPGYLQIVPPMVTTNALSSTGADDILDAQLAVIDEEDNNIHLFANLRCGPRVDNQHVYQRGYYQHQAPAAVATIAHVEGRQATGGRGPRFTSATLVAGTREMRLIPTHDGPGGTKLAGRKGADLTDATIGTLDQDATGLSQFSDRRPTTDITIGVTSSIAPQIGADSTGSKFTRQNGSGSFVTDGFKVGDIVTPDGFSGGVNDGTPFTITALSALNMTVTPAPTTVAAAAGVTLEVNPGHLGYLKVKSAAAVETLVEITEAFIDAGDEVVLRWTTGPTLESGGQCAFRHQRGNEPPRHMCIFDTQGRPAQPSRSTVRGNGGWQYHDVP